MIVYVNLIAVFVVFIFAAALYLNTLHSEPVFDDKAILRGITPAAGWDHQLRMWYYHRRLLWITYERDYRKHNVRA